MCIKISVKRLGNHDYDWVLVFCCALLFSLSNPCPGNGRTQLSPTCLAPSNIGLTLPAGSQPGPDYVSEGHGARDITAVT